MDKLDLAKRLLEQLNMPLNSKAHSAAWIC